MNTAEQKRIKVLSERVASLMELSDALEHKVNDAKEYLSSISKIKGSPDKVKCLIEIEWAAKHAAEGLAKISQPVTP